MKVKFGILSLFVFVLFLTGCSSTKIAYDHSIDFKQYKTYAFYKKGLEKLRVPPKKKKFIVHTISEVLLNKGFSRSSHPDLVINVFTNLHDRVDVYPRYYSPYYTQADVIKSKEGTLFIDIIDMKHKKVVWSGSQYLNLSGNDYRQFKNAIRTLLKNFPPEK